MCVAVCSIVCCIVYCRVQRFECIPVHVAGSTGASIWTNTSQLIATVFRDDYTQSCYKNWTAAWHTALSAGKCANWWPGYTCTWRTSVHLAWLEHTAGPQQCLHEKTVTHNTPPTKYHHTSKVVELLRAIMKHNFLPAILIVAGGVMYSTIIQSSGCPIIIANGPSQTKKSTSMNVVLPIMGIKYFVLFYVRFIFSMALSSGLPREAMYEWVTNAFILERASASTLPFAVDDFAVSNKQYNLNDVIVDLLMVEGQQAWTKGSHVQPQSQLWL